MVDLDRVPRRLATTQQPTSRITGADIAGPFHMLSQAMGEWVPGLTEVARKQGERAGFERAVTMGDDGLPTVTAMPRMAGAYGEGFRRAATFKYFADLAPAIDKQITTARNEFAGNPAGFEAWAKGYGRELSRREKDPAMRASVEKMATEASLSAWRSIDAEFQRAVVGGALASLSARRQTISNTLGRLVREGATNTPEYVEALQDFDAIGRELAGNPVFLTTAEEIAGDRESLLTGLEAEAVIGVAERRARMSGGTVVDRIMGAESGGDAAATNPESSATGAGQFIESTWLTTIKRHRPELAEGKTDAQVLALRTDAALSREMTTRLASENAGALDAAGHATTAGNVYLAHFLGQGGAVGVLGAAAETPIRDALIAGGLSGTQADEAIAANKSVLSGKTAGDVRAWAASKMGEENEADILAWADSALSEIDLSPDERRRFLSLAKSAVSTVQAGQRQETAALTAAVNDDLASIESTGKPVIDNPASVAQRLTPAAGAKFLLDRDDATFLWASTADFGMASPDAIMDRLVTLEPEAGAPGFARATQIFEAAEKRATAALKLREDDPATAARAFPRVQEAEAAFDPNDPATLGALIVERMTAQDALGVPELARNPLTTDEASALARVVTAALPGAEQVAAMQALIPEIERRYGRHADAVLRQVLSARGVDRELATYGAGLLRRLNRGDTATTGDGRNVDTLSDADTANRGMTPFPPTPDFRQVPNVPQISRLLSNPDMAADFDNKFGTGSAQFYLEARRQREDATAGFTVNPDGTENFDPEAAARSTPTRDATIARYRAGLAAQGVTGTSLDKLVTTFTEAFDANMKARQ